MWLVTTLVAAVAVTVLCLSAKNLGKYNLAFLALMLWGTFVMVLVDHAIAFFNGGGEFIKVTTDGLIGNGAVLGIAMLMPIFAIWLASLIYAPPSAMQLESSRRGKVHAAEVPLAEKAGQSLGLERRPILPLISGK